MKINGFNPELYGAQLVSYSVEGCDLKETYFLAPSAIFPTRLKNKPRLRKISLTFDFEGNDTHDATKKMSDLTAVLMKQAELQMPDKFYYYCILTGTGKATTKAPWIEQCTYTLIGLRHGELETLTLNGSSSIFVEGNCETECRFIIDTPLSTLTINDILIKNISGQIVIDGMETLIQQDGVNKFADCDLVDFPSLTPGNNEIVISGPATVVIQYYPIYV